MSINWIEADLKKLTLPDMATGRSWLEEVRLQQAQVLNALRASADDNQKYAALLDDSYKLKQARHAIQSCMTALFRSTRTRPVMVVTK